MRMASHSGRRFLESSDVRFAVSMEARASRPDSSCRSSGPPSSRWTGKSQFLAREKIIE